MKIITTAGLLLNNVKAPISSIEFDSTDMSKEEIVKEIKRQFGEVLSYEFDEKESAIA